MNGILNSAANVVWGTPMLLFYLSAAVMFTIKSRLFQLTGINRWMSGTLLRFFKPQKSEKTGNGISQFGAFCSVLAACIGTGNIVGVASAIASGGAGTVFWMCLSAFLGMATSYAENSLGIKYRRKVSGKVKGGAFMYMHDGVKMPGLAKAYAGLCLFSSLGSGNMTQANSVSESLFRGFGIPQAVTGIAVAAICFLIIRGGVKRIAKINEYAVPAMSLGFLSLSLWILLKNRKNLLPCSINIINGAFKKGDKNKFSGKTAMRYGIARGVFSNEAGIGSSTIIHAEDEASSATDQGCLGAFEVFTDTILLCTITALSILVSGVWNEGSRLFGAELSIAAYASVGEWGKKGIALLTAVFGFASLVGWSFYGEKSREEIFKERFSEMYKYLYCSVAFLGCISSPKIIWSLSDITNGLMALPNLFSVISLRNEVSWEKKIRRTGASPRIRFRRA
ncbi:MAG: alanine/glycine:cation symporter family protein [Acutalibacteraceae bacterium]